MEWQQLHYFMTVARMQHMTKAAESLSLSQPALSRSIARLEEELGVPLFDRQGRSIQLNRYGALFLQRVKSMQSEYNKALNELEELNNPEYGTISLGFLHTLGTNIVPDLIGDFRKFHPHVQFALTQNYSHSQVKLLLAGDIDLCLLASTEIEPPVQWQELWRDELFLMVPANHPLAQKKQVRLSELEDEQFIHLKRNYILRKTAEKFFSAADITPNITFELDEVSTIAGFVAAGLGVSLLPNDENYNPNKICKIPISDIRCERVIGMAWVNERTVPPSTAAFRDFILQHFAKRKGGTP